MYLIRTYGHRNHILNLFFGTFQKNFRKNGGISLPRVNLSLAEMLVRGLARCFFKDYQ